MSKKSEAFKILEETQNKEANQKSIPISSDEDSGKPHRLSFNIGCFNDGLRTSFCLRRLLTEYDETVFGIQKNPDFDQLRQYFTHSQVFKLNKSLWDAEFAYEFDHKQSKFLTKEKSIIIKVGPQASKWRFRIEGTQRKNLIDYYSSMKYLKNETMITYKQSIGLQYVDFNENTYKKFDIEMAVPQGLGHFNGMPSFFKVDGFITRSQDIIKEKLKAVYTLQGGIIRPMFGSSKTAINDRLFITNSMGYTHLGHIFDSNSPIREEHAKVNADEVNKYEKVVVGDDLGSQNYLLAQARLEFLSIPYLMKIGLRTFTYAELAFYPSLKIKKIDINAIKQNTRFSGGFGLCIPLNQMVSILIYYNALNFNTAKKGDVQRNGYINVNLGFF